MGLSSPFASRLGTNYIPPDGEVLEIQSLLVKPVSRIKRLDDQIADLQKAISELNEERSSVTDYVEAHRALIFPARRLPLDMLQEIFVACLPTHRNCVMLAPGDSENFTYFLFPTTSPRLESLEVDT
ncbi:hypothetical protein B0H14DRAFT_2379335 [Mycena olivaceomarginata]|nr:hypothetical protein B0H14DRAFT_2379335 [Mycena olivaceomarginata]